MARVFFTGSEKRYAGFARRAIERLYPVVVLSIDDMMSFMW